MHRSAWSWLCLLLVGVAPAALAYESEDLRERVDLCIITYRPAADFSRVNVAADQEKTPEQMAALLDDVDADDDGNVTRQEIIDHELRSVRSEDRVDELGPLRLKMDGQDPQRVTFVTRLYGFEGNITASQARLVTEERTYHYATRAVGEHVLEGGLGDRPPGDGFVIEFVVLEAPEGWLVDSVNGTVYAQSRVELPAFDTQRYFVVTYMEAETPTVIPVVGAPLAILACLGLALALRRQKG